MSQDRRSVRQPARPDQPGGDNTSAENAALEETGDAQTGEVQSGQTQEVPARPEEHEQPLAEGEAGTSSESEELARMRGAMLRLSADMDNREKRLQREMERARKFAIDSLLRDLVPALDSMDQALAAAAEESGSKAVEGLELTRRQLLGVLEKHGLEVLEPVGERFDPSWHEAMTTCPAEDLEPETVAQVLQKGYVLNERLIRPARVIVAK